MVSVFNLVGGIWEFYAAVQHTMPRYRVYGQIMVKTMPETDESG
jgi:hypothetical protein